MAEPFDNEFPERSVVFPCVTNNRKVPMRFSCNHDILLLREVVAVNPYAYENPKSAWKTISENLWAYYTVDGRSCRERTTLLLQYYDKDVMEDCRQFFEAKTDALRTHCAIHREVLASKYLRPTLNQDLEYVVNFIKTRPLKVRFFKKLCEDVGSEYTSLLYYSSREYKTLPRASDGSPR
ncbi:uncharacterized protein LOC111639713 [Centruroides sculpturatus]|uniref:uncharacterized protein LOC111639713 n=1 Tax=Centruroides sculpturatus TaxID=218467 RepID=UPI000C6DD2EF|nr:uncharacterized protein LOC111639713 [Centruroides sculpturatus]